MSHIYQPKDTAVFWIAYYRNGKLVRESLHTRDRTTAKYLQAKNDQNHIEGKYITVDADVKTVLEEYKLAGEHQKGKRTNREDEARIRNFIDWTHIQKIKDISEKNLQDYFNERIKTGLKLNTINRYRASIKAFLNFSIRRKYIYENPLRYIKEYKVPKNPPRFLTKDEISAVIKEAKKTDLYPMVATAIYTGMRRAELFALEWQDLDFKQNIITVRNKSDFTTKSKKFRIIPISPILRPILVKIRQKEGHCFDIINQRRVVNRILRNAKVKNTGIAWHLFRHTFGTQLAMAGVDVVTIKELMGHESVETTMIYLHAVGSHVKDSIGKLKLRF
ncbi:MAG: tyrosine-type recombinase/integrase [Candidatus Omnitrophica bacterium]|nr:tyrosine-type recombinase/integrase [Candidatus Omnitrophota bacterium]